MIRPSSFYESVVVNGALVSRAKAKIVPFAWLVALGAFLLAGTAESATASGDAPLPNIPIQIINTNAGRVMTASAEKYEAKIYITGLVYRPSSPGIGAHVHVWGVDKNNHKVFFKTTYVEFTGKPSFHRTESYVVSISPAVFAKAQKIFVTFHSEADDDSKTEDTSN